MLELETPVDESVGERPGEDRGPGGIGLCFDASGGPLAAVCGLCGGAGASTLAYTLAAAAAGRSTQPVFACETSGMSGGLALYARVSLAEAANQLAAGEPPAGLVSSSPEQVRILGSRPSAPERADSAGIARILAEARAAGGLVVLDCGTAGHEVDRRALALAAHVLWVMPATVSGIARSERALELLGAEIDAPQALVARLDRSEQSAPVSELAGFAAGSGLELILFPHVEDIARALVAEAIEDAQVALEAIAAVLCR